MKKTFLISFISLLFIGCQTNKDKAWLPLGIELIEHEYLSSFKFDKDSVIYTPNIIRDSSERYSYKLNIDTLIIEAIKNYIGDSQYIESDYKFLIKYNSHDSLILKNLAYFDSDLDLRLYKKEHIYDSLLELSEIRISDGLEFFMLNADLDFQLKKYSNFAGQFTNYTGKVNDSIFKINQEYIRYINFKNEICFHRIRSHQLWIVEIKLKNGQSFMYKCEGGHMLYCLNQIWDYNTEEVPQLINIQEVKSINNSDSEIE